MNPFNRHVSFPWDAPGYLESQGNSNDVNNIFGLKGLTRKDYAEWEKEYADEIAGLSEDQKRKNFISWHYVDKHGLENIKAFQGMTEQEQIDAFNQDAHINTFGQSVLDNQHTRNENKTDIIDSGIDAGMANFNFSDDPYQRQHQLDVFSQKIDETQEEFTPEMYAFLTRNYAKAYVDNQLAGKTEKEKVKFYNDTVKDSQDFENSTFGKVTHWLGDHLPNWLLLTGGNPTTAYTYANNNQQLYMQKEAADRAAEKEQKTKYAFVEKRVKEYYEDNAEQRLKDIEDIKRLTAEKSSFYKEYKDTYLKDMTDKDWEDLLIQYRANLQGITEELQKSAKTGADIEEINSKAQFEALKELQDAISAKVYHNMPEYEIWGNAAGNFGVSCISGIIGLVGVLGGAASYAFTGFDRPEGMGIFAGGLNQTFDNAVTRYADRLSQTGYFSMSEEQERHFKETGLSRFAIANDKNDKSIAAFLGHDIPNAISQGGYTLASILEGQILGKMAQKAFKYAPKAYSVYRKIDTIEDIVERQREMRKVLQYTRKAENFTNKIIIPGIVGSGEGAIEGLQVKQSVLEQGQQQIIRNMEAYYGEEINQAASILLKNPKAVQQILEEAKIDPNEVNTAKIQQVVREYAMKNMQEYKDSEKQLEYAAATAGNYNFLINSCINGLINATFQTGMQSNTVQEALSRSKLWTKAARVGQKLGISNGNTIRNVTAENGRLIAHANKLGWKAKAWNFFKEPIGEGLEEYELTLSSAATEAGGLSNIDTFMQCRYKGGNASARIGAQFYTDFSNSMRALGEAAVDEESFKAAYYGALGSLVGTPALPKFKGRYKRDANGNLILDKHGNPEMTYGNEAIEGESKSQRTFRFIKQALPWRTGMSNGIKEVDHINNTRQTIADNLTEWLNDPNHVGKFNDVVTSLNWMELMNDEAVGNNTKGYRDAMLGKHINDVLTLQLLQGTEYYDSIIEQMNAFAQFDQLTQELQERYLVGLREKEQFKGMSDQQIAAKIKNNAVKMLESMNQINEIKESIEGYIGEVDNDTMTALIYGQMALKDWEERSEQLNTELDAIADKVVNSVDRSTIDKNLLWVLTRFGSYKTFAKNISTLENDIARLKNNIKIAEAQLEREPHQDLINDIERYKYELQAKEKALKTMKSKKELINNDNIEVPVLSEKDIMALPAAERQRLFDKRNRKKLSEAQQEVLNRLEQHGTKSDPRFLEKINDAAEIEGSMTQTLTQYNEILSNPEYYNLFIQKTKSEARQFYRKQQYMAIAGIKDYTKFAEELDKLYKAAPGEVDLGLLSRILKEANPDFLKKYSEGKSQKIDLLQTAATDPEFKDISTNDKDVLLTTIDFLNSKGVDLYDKDAVSNALQALNEDGSNQLSTYIDQVNSTLENDKMKFPGMNAMWDFLEKVVTKHQLNVAEQLRLARTPQPAIEPIDPITTPESAPAPSIVIPGQEATLEKPTVVTTTPNVRQEAPANLQSTGDEILDNFIRNNYGIDSIEKAASFITGGIRSSMGQTSVEVIDTALNKLSDLSKRQYEDEEDFGAAIQKASIELKSDSLSDDDVNYLAGELLQKKYESFITKRARQLNREAQLARLQSLRVSPTGSLFQGNVSERYKQSLRLERTAAQNRVLAEVSSQVKDTEWFRTGEHPDLEYTLSMEGIMGTLDLESWSHSRNYPQDIHNYRVTTKMDEYLSVTPAKELQTKPVYFYSPSLLDMSTKFPNFVSSVDQILVAIVLDNNGTVVIDGVRYLPIGIMPSSYDGKTPRKYASPNLRGAGRSKFIRDRIQAIGFDTILTDESGTKITTRITEVLLGKPQSTHEGYRAVNGIDMESVGAADRAQLEGKSKLERRKTVAYQNARTRFINNFRKDPKGNPGIYLEAKDVYGNPISSGRVHLHVIDAISFSKTVGRNTEMTLLEVVDTVLNDPSKGTMLYNSADSEGNFNSRTKYLGKTLRDFVANFNYAEFDKPGMDINERWNKIKDELCKTEIALSKALKEKSGVFWNDVNMQLLINISDLLKNGKPVYTISARDRSGSVTPLLEFTQDGVTDAEIGTALANFFSLGGKLNTGMRWQLAYSELNHFIEKNGAITANSFARSYIADLYDDGLVLSDRTVVHYTVKSIKLLAPYTTEGDLIDYKYLQVGNRKTDTTNVTTPGTVVTPQNVEVIPETGTVVSGTVPTPQTDSGNLNVQETPEAEAARTLGDFIQEESLNWTLDDDGRAYINTQDPNRTRHARVTSVHPADSTASDEDYFPEGNWTTEGKLLQKKFESVKQVYHEQDDAYSEFADLVFDTCAKLGFNIEMVTPETLGAVPGDPSTFGVVGDFDVETSTIRISTLAATIAKKNDSNLGRVMLHEAIHALTSYAIRNKAVLNKKSQDAVTAIEACYQRALAEYGAEKDTNPDLYGLTSPIEMVAELANPKFREKLQKVSLMDKLIGAVTNLLNFLFDAHFVDRSAPIERTLLKSVHTLMANYNAKAYTVTSKGILGARWAKENMNIVTCKEDTLKAITDAIKEGKSTVTIPANTNVQGLLNTFKARGYNVGNIVRFSTNDEELGVLARLVSVEDGKFTLKIANVFTVGEAIVRERQLNYEGPKNAFEVNKWTLPSTNIGTGVDEFIRDFFTETNNLSTSPSKEDMDRIFNNLMKNGRPNSTTEEWRKLFEQMIVFKYSYCNGQGLHVLPRDVVAHGTIPVRHGKGSKARMGKLNVAGTIDLLLYDDLGYFYIFDMKTSRGPLDTETGEISLKDFDHKIPKYRRLVSMYQKLITEFIKSRGGDIKFKGLGLIPIAVSYDSPVITKNNPVAVDYKLGEGNQLLCSEDGGVTYNEVRSVKMTLLKPVRDKEGVTYQEPDIEFNRLLSQYQAMVTWDDEQPAPPTPRRETDTLFSSTLNSSIENASQVEETPQLPEGTSNPSAQPQLVEQPLGNTEEVTPEIALSEMAQPEEQPVTPEPLVELPIAETPAELPQPEVKPTPKPRPGRAIVGRRDTTSSNRTRHVGSNQNDKLVLNTEMLSIRDEAIKTDTYMTAPNGKKTNLSEKLWLLVRSKSFKEEFGDWESAESDVVLDENGEPKLVYGVQNAEADWSLTSTQEFFDSMSKFESDKTNTKHTAINFATALSEKYGVSFPIIMQFFAENGQDSYINDAKAFLASENSGIGVSLSNELKETTKLAIDMMETNQFNADLYDALTEGMLSKVFRFQELTANTEEQEYYKEEYEELKKTIEELLSDSHGTLTMGFIKNSKKGKSGLYSVKKKDMKSKFYEVKTAQARETDSSVGLNVLLSEEFNSNGMNVTTSLAYLAMQNPRGYVIASRYNQNRNSNTAWDNLTDEEKEAYLKCGC